MTAGVWHAEAIEVGVDVPHGIARRLWHTGRLYADERSYQTLLVAEVYPRRGTFSYVAYCYSFECNPVSPVRMMKSKATVMPF